VDNNPNANVVVKMETAFVLKILLMEENVLAHKNVPQAKLKNVTVIVQMVNADVINQQLTDKSVHVQKLAQK
jgi:hypothetical protein